MGPRANGKQALLRNAGVLGGFCILAFLLLGDGGTLQFQKQAGLLLINVFSAPVPLRVGTADLSVLVQRAADRSNLLDCAVVLELSKRGERAMRAHATRAQATNKLMYAAQIVFPSPGDWHVNVEINAQGNTVQVDGNVNVLPEQEPAIAYWPYFAVLPVTVALFALNQWLKARRTVKNPRARPSRRSVH